MVCMRLIFACFFRVCAKVHVPSNCIRYGKKEVSVGRLAEIQTSTLLLTQYG